MSDSLGYLALGTGALDLAIASLAIGFLKLRAWWRDKV